MENHRKENKKNKKEEKVAAGNCSPATLHVTPYGSTAASPHRPRQLQKHPHADTPPNSPKRKRQKPKSKPCRTPPDRSNCAAPAPAPNRTTAPPPMSFLAGRMAAAKEGAYFLHESKTAVGRLAEKLPASASAPGGASAPPSPDVLPEILRHSVPIKGTPPPAQPTLSASSRWAIPPGSAEAAGLHPDALNPLRSYVSLPQATFGPKRY